MNDNDAKTQAFFSSLRHLLLIIGTLMAAHGLTDSSAYQYVEIAASCIMILGPAVWGVIQPFVNVKKSNLVAAVAVQSAVAAQAPENAPLTAEHQQTIIADAKAIVKENTTADVKAALSRAQA